MSPIEYVGEWLWAAHWGKFFIAAALTSALLGAIAGIRALRRPDDPWAFPVLRATVWIHLVAVVGIGTILYILIYNHRFEFYYVWQHSSITLPIKYIISSMWEGQEGSFWLWMLWNSVLLTVLVRKSRPISWGAAGVVFVSQVMFASMLLGVEVFGVKIGSNPLALLREAMDAPIFSRPDYLQFITDGTGLNPLLQSYWMVIHPPMLFIGFAGAGIPFAIVMAHLLAPHQKHWLPLLHRWALWGAAFLGFGIILGAAWAYEALNFGGYWAWDPVENSSLVPWIILVAAIHLLLIYRARKAYLRLTLAFFLLAYWLILYSTFLTRSGVLGNASVHSFTDMGLGGQLTFWLAFFAVGSVAALARRWKQLATPAIPEHLYSREFWMYVGSLVLFLAAFHIIAVTSLPVLNKVLGTQLAPPTDPIDHYNRVQLPVAVVVLILSAVAMFLQYRQHQARGFWKRFGVTVAAALLITALTEWAWQLRAWPFRLLSWAGWTALLANGHLLWGYLRKRRWRLIGGALAHVGLALMILGVLVSSAKKNVISRNIEGIDFGDEFSMQTKLENVLIFEDSSTWVGPYRATYLGSHVDPPLTLYEVRFADSASGETFTLFPSAQISKDMGLVASPDIRKWWDRDLYVHITAIPDTGTAAFAPQIAIADTLKIPPTDTTLTWQGWHIRSRGIYTPAEPTDAANIQVQLVTEWTDSTGTRSVTLQPQWHLQDGQVRILPDRSEDLLIHAELIEILPQEEKIRIVLARLQPPPRPYIILKAIVFPFINLLWLGTLLMTLGFVIAAVARKVPGR